MDTLWTVIRDSFSKVPGAKFYFLEDRKRENDLLLGRADAMRGVPRLSEFSFINWTGGGGHIGFSPVSPTRGKEAMKQYTMISQETDMMRFASVGIAVLFAGTSAFAADEPQGKAIFDHNCAVCHAAGPGHPGTQRLTEVRGADRAVLEQRNDLTSDYIRMVVRKGLVEMPPWRPVEIDDAALAQLVRYLTHGRK
jgi:(+)-pinoresinol hydroxylase